LITHPRVVFFFLFLFFPSYASLIDDTQCDIAALPRCRTAA
jgi:hypothetical protein